MPEPISLKSSYILSVAATGKSSFAKSNPFYNGFKVVDVAELLPQPGVMVKWILYFSRLFKPLKNLVKYSPSQLAKSEEHYHKIITDYLSSQQTPTAVLGNRGPKNLKPYENFSIAAVIIPEEQHMRNCGSRKQQLRNPIPFLHHRSTKFENIIPLRENLKNYADRHQIRVFTSFEQALDSCREKNLNSL